MFIYECRCDTCGKQNPVNLNPFTFGSRIPEGWFCVEAVFSDSVVSRHFCSKACLDNFVWAPLGEK